MKTLDEVIEALEDEGVFPDALYYLKMYRSDMQMYAENQKYWEDELKQKIKDFGDAKERYIAKLKELEIGTLNNPLTWDELKQMEGKPAWIEEQYRSNEEWYGHWEVVSSVYDEEYVDDPDSVVYMTDDEIRHKNDLGKTWNAYRKERK